MTSASVRFLGRGWRFPVGLAADGTVETSAEAEDVRESIRIILGTNKGERVMRPDFGADLGRLVFEPLNTTTMSLARHYVEEALTVWEPRIDHVEVTVSADRPAGRLLIEIRYRIRSSNTFYNLVYPFYLLEAEAAR
jgi:phage baseplate assembly protein W